MNRNLRVSSLGMERFSGLYLWALVIVVFSIWIPDLFFQTATAKSIAASQSIIAVIAVAATISLAVGAFDVSVGAVANLSTITVIALQSIYGWGATSSIIAAILVGVAVGFVNGFVIVVLKVAPVVATLGMGSVLLAAQAIISDGGQPLPPTDPSWPELMQRDVFGLQAVVFYMLFIALVAWWVLEHTPIGRYVYAIGGNADAARLSGVRTGKWTWLALIGCSTTCAVAGVMYASLSGPSLTYGGTTLLPAFAAAFLGSTQLRPGRFNVGGTLIAVFVLATGVQGLQLVTGEYWISDLFSGLALLVAVSFAGWRQRRAVSTPKAAGRGAHPDDDRTTPTRSESVKVG